jgi:hypothetical protein
MFKDCGHVSNSRRHLEFHVLNLPTSQEGREKYTSAIAKKYYADT